MTYVTVQMLFGDRAKLFGLVFSLAFASFLLMNQSSIFAGIMSRTGSQILDVIDAPVWVMDPKTPYADELAPMTDNQLFRVRGVDAVSWAVPLYKGSARAKTVDGTFRQCVLMGVDDATLTGAARKVVLGSMEALREPNTIMLDKAGYGFFFPGQPLQFGRTLEMNDRRVVIGAISDARTPFATFPVIYTRYSLHGCHPREPAQHPQGGAARACHRLPDLSDGHRLRGALSPAREGVRIRGDRCARVARCRPGHAAW